MRMKWIFITLCMISLIVLIGCVSQPPTQSPTLIQQEAESASAPLTTNSVVGPEEVLEEDAEPVQVTPVPMKPNTGHITGKVIYLDNTPASQVGVYIFEKGAFMSTSHDFTNGKGEYIFSDLPVGEYEIYAAIYRDYGLETPDKTVRVNDQQITTVLPIVVPREVEFDFGDDYPYDIELVISWTSVPNAVEYTVNVASNLGAASPGPIGYNNIATTTEIKIKWPSLELGAYKISICAYDQDKKMIGIGHDFFTIVDSE